MSQRHKILTVDDNATNQLFYEELLEEDYELQQADDGEAALAALAGFAPDIVLLDIMMPGMDGYELCQKIRKMPEHRHIKVILVSAKNMTEDRLKGYECGADDYISKPFDHDELAAKLTVYLKLKSAEELDGFKTDVLTMLSSDTLTPVTGVRTPLNYLLKNDGKLSPEERRRHLLKIDANASRLQSLLEKVLTLSSIKAGTFKVNPEINSLENVVGEALEIVAPLAQSENVKVETGNLASGLARFDHERIRDIIVIALENAIEASAEKAGTVTVDVVVDGADYRISVVDKGAGIRNESLAKVFEFSLDQGTRKVRESRGMSLHLAREVLNIHNGSIDLNSDVGQGTECVIKIAA